MLKLQQEYMDSESEDEANEGTCWVTLGGQWVPTCCVQGCNQLMKLVQLLAGKD